MFAQFAYPPNELGLCGPSDAPSLLEQTGAAEAGPDLRHAAQGFEGAWPYLQLIAAANHLPDPLDPRVVEAYWIGNDLLDRIPVALLGGSLEDRFRRRAGGQWEPIAAGLEVGARPHHNFHVFAVYPWVGLLRDVGGGEPLRVLDRCRVRVGRVDAIVGDEAHVTSRSLIWNGRVLVQDEAEAETVRWRLDGHALAAPPEPGAFVAMHWDWICQSLTAAQVAALERETATNLSIANSTLMRADAGDHLA